MAKSTKTEMLGDYRLTSQLTSQNSGFSVWGYGVKNGTEYFIKQFLSPKYPDNDSVSSPERIKRKIAECTEFEWKKRRLYQTLNRCSDGNALRVNEFFRVGSNYYIATQKIVGPSWDLDKIAALRFEDRQRLCSTIAHSVAGFHEGGLVHADLKHTNILFTHGSAGIMTTKIIDFDSSFLETEPPHADEEIIGDQVYFSPEACMHTWGEEVELTCKMDVFAMGVLFHQYLTGELPGFDHEEFGSAGEAVANGEQVTVSEKLPQKLRELLQSMLQYDPKDRPFAADVFEALYCGPAGAGGFLESGATASEAMVSAGAPLGRGGFHSAGDLL